MPNEWMPVLYVAVLVIVALAVIVAAVIWRRMHPPEILTPEQEGAVRRQGNALGILIFLQFGLLGIGLGIVKLFPVLEDQVKTVAFAILFVAGIIIGFYIAISSIVDQISILGGGRWGRNEYPKGSAAIQWGIFILVMIGLALYVAWLKLTGQ